MPTTLVTGVSNAGTFDIRPPVGEAWCITDFFSDIRQAGLVPDLSVAFADGVATAGDIIIDPATAVQKQYRNFEIYIDRDTYLTVTETGAASVIGWIGHQVIPDSVKSRIVTVPNAAPAKFDVRPPVGEIWKVTEIGAETYHANNFPDVLMSLESLTNTGAIIADGSRALTWNGKLAIYLSNDFFLSLDAIGAADNDIGLSIVRVPVEIFADCFTLLSDATIVVQPPEGTEAVITHLGSDVWAGVAPAGGLDTRFSLTDGVTPSTWRSEASVIVDINPNRQNAFMIDNTNYLQIFEPTTANQEIAYTGYIRREEHTT